MPLKHSRDPRLDYYLDESNLDRISELMSSSFGYDFLNGSSLSQVDLDVIVLNLNNFELINQIYAGANKVFEQFKVNNLNVRFLIGDTGSTDVEVLELYSKIDEDFFQVKKDLVYNFSSCNNYLSNLGNSRAKLFLNNDVLINENPSAIFRAYEVLMSNNKIGVVGAKLDFPNSTIQHYGIDFLRDPEVRGLPFHPMAGETSKHIPGQIKTYKASTGAFLMVKTEALDSVGGFNEKYKAECQDVELCLAILRTGLECVVIDCGRLVHIENSTRPKGEENWEDRRYFLRRWSSYIETLIS